MHTTSSLGIFDGIRPARRRAIRWFVAVATRFFAAPERLRQRRAFAALPDYLLQDIGLTRAHIEGRSSLFEL